MRHREWRRSPTEAHQQENDHEASRAACLSPVGLLIGGLPASARGADRKCMPCDDQGPRPRRKDLGMDVATQRAVARTGERPFCFCLASPYDNKRWRELTFHLGEQNTNCGAWKHLPEVVDRCALGNQ